jgi:hypothetical protein
MSVSKMGMMGCAAVVAVVVGCAKSPAETDDGAPDVALDVLDVQDEGVTYNGWTQSITGTCLTSINAESADHTLTRSSGDSTRGGGACGVVLRLPLTTCSADSQCQAGAVALYGSSAYGYCYKGFGAQHYCYDRPGSQAANCALNPNRSPGTLSSYNSCIHTNVLGCMTKTVGPNTACGGTDTSLYMRTVSYVNQY